MEEDSSEGSGDIVVTMTQLVDAYDGLIEEAKAQEEQEWGDADKCTYCEGYISQPVYACATCNSKTTNGEVFGFCFGCSMSCHLDHDVFELFEKRNFRCDCTTSKSVHLCTLNPKVITVNTGNVYNHNYRGLYCWCNLPYDHNSNVVMIQCYMCQDWFHDTCILNDYPYTIPEEHGNDFICKDCMSKCKCFLGKYPHFEYIEIDEDNENKSSTVNSIEEKEDSETNIIVKTKEEENVPETMNKNVNIKEEDKVPETKNVNVNIKEEKVPETINVNVNTTEEIVPEQNECLISSLKETSRLGNYFFRSGWRESLCHCARCLKMYQLIGVEYLLKKDIIKSSSEDSPNNQEETQTNKTDIFEQQMNTLTLKREIAYGINEFRDNLMEFLKPFATQKRTVTVADIEQFKEQFQNKKKKK